MKNKSFSRLESSQALDELLVLNDRRHPPNWLLTYLDVFVLIVMLVVTLVALSRFDPATAPTETNLRTERANDMGKPDTDIPNRPGGTVTPADEGPMPRETAPVSSPEPAESKAPQTPEPAVAPATKQPSPAAQPIAPVDDQAEVTVTDQATGSPANALDEPVLQHRLEQQLKKLGLDDSINMTVAQGYAQLEIQDKILYQSSEAQLTETGLSVLSRLTPLLKQSSGLIYIEGHTDNRPIQTPKYPSNWELGAARATSVLHFLAEQQIDATRMRAVTYADSKPIAENDTEEGRQKNRRVNIIIKVSDDIN